VISTLLFLFLLCCISSLGKRAYSNNKTAADDHVSVDNEETLEGMFARTVGGTFAGSGGGELIMVYKRLAK
jgi:hypothetical protein